MVCLGTESSCSVAPDDSRHLDEIPEATGDNWEDLKRRLMLLSDPDKIGVWLDVIKRGIIAAKPIFARAEVQEALSTSEEVEVVVCCSALPFRAAKMDRKVQLEPEEEEEHGVELGMEVAEEMPLEAADDLYDECYSSEPEKLDASANLSDRCAAVSCRQVEVEQCEDLGGGKTSPPVRITSKIEGPPRHSLAVLDASAAAAWSESPMPTMVPTEWMFRRPFQVLAPLLRTCTILADETAGLIDLEITLGQAAIEPGEHQWADVRYHLQQQQQPQQQQEQEATEKAVILPSVDVLWYFAARPEELRCLTPMPAAVSPSASGSFQLFLPDPSLLDKLGTETEVFANEGDDGPAAAAAASPSPPASTTWSNPFSRKRSPTGSKAATATTNARSPTRGRSRSRVALASTKRVSFQEEEEEGEKAAAITRSGRQSSIKRKAAAVPSNFVSYQTPVPTSSTLTNRNRSSSNRRGAAAAVVAATADLGAATAAVDRQAMASLKTSVRQASDLLDRRRRREEEEDNAVLAMRGSSRGRPSERGGTAVSSSSSSSSSLGARRKLSPPVLQVAEAGGVAIRGLLGMAQQLVAPVSSPSSRSPPSWPGSEAPPGGGGGGGGSGLSMYSALRKAARERSAAARSGRSARS